MYKLEDLQGKNLRFLGGNSDYYQTWDDDLTVGEVYELKFYDEEPELNILFITDDIGEDVDVFEDSHHEFLSKHVTARLNYFEII